MSSGRINFDLTAALEDAERRYADANPDSARIHGEACESMPGGNTRTVLYFPPFPLCLARGEGCHLVDVDGHRYADFVCEQTAGLYGHSDARIQRAVSTALGQGIVLGGQTAREVTLAEILCDRFPALERVRFTNSGTEANLLALSAARAITGRSGILAFDGCYHGSVLSFGGYGNRLNVPFEWVLGRYNDIAMAEELVAEHGSDLAAIIVEPMTGSGGCIPASREFLRTLRDLADRSGALLHFDEVMTSRLGPGGLQQHHGITPDMASFGKYLGGGLNFGAFGGRGDLMARFDPREPGHFGHAGTFNNNPLTMQAGIAGLTEIFTEERAIELNRRGDILRDRLNAAISDRGVGAQVTGFGSMMMFHPTAAALTAPTDAAAADPKARALFHLEMMARAQYVARRGMMTLSLPMQEDEFDGLAAAFGDFLDTYGELFPA